MSGAVATSLLAYLAFVLKLSLGIVFLLSSIPKWRHPLIFAESVVNYRVLPITIAYVFALALIPLETLLALAFLTGWLTEIALLGAMIMLVAFLIAVGVNVKRGRQIPCGCFGATGEHISARTLVRLFLLLAVVLFLMVFRTTEDLPWQTLRLAMIDVSTLLYLLQSVSLATFFLLLATWVLALPELVLVIAHLTRGQPPLADQNDQFEEGA